MRTTYSFDVDKPTQRIKIPATSGTQFWNVIPNTVESSVKNCRYAFITEPFIEPANR